jgi:hypothetical protein
MITFEDLMGWFIDYPWEGSFTEWRTQVSNIVIPDDLNTADIKLISSQISEAYENIRKKLAETRSLKEWLNTKIDFLEKTTTNDGRNDAERRANGRIAASTYAFRGQPVSLYECLGAVRTVNERLDSYVDILEKKQSLIIPMSLALKLEAGLVT